MTDLDALIKALEKAEGPSRELDARIARTLAGSPKEHWFALEGDYITNEKCKPYTASVDAALTLVPDSIWLRLESGTQPDPTMSWIWPVVEIGYQETGDSIWKGQGVTIPVTICIAALRARAALARGREE